MKRIFFLFLTFVILSSAVHATHIVGGTLLYEHLGGATYRVTLKLYRDCGPSSVFFPSSVRIEVRQPNGASFSPDKDITIPLSQTVILDPPIDTCAFNPGVCVEEAIYTKVVNNLPPNPGGYHLFYTTCCRNASIVNLVNPLSTGEAFYTYIPDNSQYMTNSAPQWKEFPPVFICQGQPLYFDHGATDKDGDSLVYSFYTPFDNNAPTFPGNVATFTPVVYNGGYSATDPLSGNSLSINPQTGVITGVPPILGQFVVGVKADEYRNGVKVSTIYRDFQFNVLNCPPVPVAAIGPTDGCSGQSIQFNNASVPLTNNNFYWDFGDPSSTTDNSTQVNPTYTYPSIGTYIVMLIAQYGTPCADTVYDTLIVSGITADFTYNDSACVGTPVTFNDASTTTSNATVTGWNWDFGDASSAVIPNPTHTYSAGNVYNVTLVATSSAGCKDTVVKPMYIQSLPQAVANDTFACVSNPVITLNGNVYGATGGLWVGNGTFSPNTTTLTPTYTPTSGELSQGYANVYLSTTGNGLCPADVDTMTISYSTGITANAGSDIYVCKDTAFISLSGSIYTAAGGQWLTSGSGTFFPNSFDLNANYIPSSADTAAGVVTIILNSVGNGNCLPDADTMQIFFTSTPKVIISNSDTACAGDQLIPLNASSTTGSGVWSTTGNGYFTPTDSLPNTYYFADSVDNANGTVTLYFTSLNNGGCKSYTDSITIALIPPPVADFGFVSQCPNVAIPFSDSSTSVSTINSWTWIFGDNTQGSGQNVSHIYDTSGFYTVSLIVSSVNGCTDTATKTVEVYAIPNADFTVNGVCENVTSEFIDQSTVFNSTINSWNWTFDNLGTDNVQNPQFTFPDSGNYNVTLIVQSAQGCIDTVTKVIAINPPPVANFTSSPSSVMIGQDFQFTDLSQVNIVNWLWNFGDSTGVATTQNPTYSYISSGYFTVCLTVTDTFGCVDSTCNDVIVFMPPAVPNAFSPNGDGENDEFKVLGGPFISLEFRVYNNWGQIIFESDKQSKGWDGTKDGIDQPVGVYVWTVKAISINGNEYNLKGDVTLLR
jgi:gliding motility-associated-like protein